MATLAQPPQGVSTGSHLDNRRMTAALIDLVVPVAIGAAAYAAGLSLTRGVLLVVVGWTLYYFFALESGDGQTLGKRVVKLRVVSADGSPASMEQIAKRTVVRILDGHIVGLIVMLATGERRQRLGDIVAGTVVTDAEATQPAPTTAVLAQPATAHLSPVPPEAPSGKSVPWHKRSLKMPSRSEPSVAKTKRSPKMPTLRKRRQPPDEALAQTSAPGPASMPAPKADAVPAVKPFDPFGEPPQAAHEARGPAPEPIEDFMEREVVIEREPTVEMDDEMDYEPAYYTHDDDSSGPTVERDDGDPVVEVDEPEPVVERHTEPEPVAPYEESHPDEGSDEPQEHVTIKPIETVSAIDLVMQDAEDRSSHDR